MHPSIPPHSQPFTIGDTPGTRLAWALNSEIYNHCAIKGPGGPLEGVRIVRDSKSDSAIIGHLLQKLGDTHAVWNALDGIFACVVIDEAARTVVAARDPMGVCPLYWGRGPDGSTWFASEMKALMQVCPDTVQLFPPGHVYHSSTGKLERFYSPPWLDGAIVPARPACLDTIHDALVGAVVKRLMSDAPLGILLSGGLDSSLVAAIAVRHLREAANAYDTDHPIHTFSVGLEGAPDLAAAREVAAHLGTTHHEITFTVDDGIDALRDLVYHIESYEQVRAAVPMYLLARAIKARGFKVVLSGEGADEVFGGYLYFHKAPSPAEFHAETVRKVTRLHQWDVLRAIKSPFACGVEPRVPFLDKGFLDVCMGIDPAAKMIDMGDKPDGAHARMEKYILRKAFDRASGPGGEPYLPENVLWRQKEQFSDGVGYSWVDGLKAYAEATVSDATFADVASRFPSNPPTTKEYFLLRAIFEDHFPGPAALATVPTGASIACSTPEAVGWDPSWAGTHEISGRALAGVHECAAGFDARAGSNAAAKGAADGG